MKLVLTDKPTGREMIVDSEHVTLMEPDSEGTGTHMVFSNGNGRGAVESITSIAALIGVIAPKSVALATVSAVAAAQVKPKKK